MERVSDAAPLRAIALLILQFSENKRRDAPIFKHGVRSGTRGYERYTVAREGRERDLTGAFGGVDGGRGSDYHWTHITR